MILLMFNPCSYQDKNSPILVSLHSPPRNKDPISYLCTEIHPKKWKILKFKTSKKNSNKKIKVEVYTNNNK